MKMKFIIYNRYIKLNKRPYSPLVFIQDRYFTCPVFFYSTFLIPERKRPAPPGQKTSHNKDIIKI